MKRINVQKDIESREKIATQITNRTIKPIKKEVTDAKSTEVQGSSTNTSNDTTTKETPPKRARATKGNTEKV